MVNAKQQLL